MASIAEHKHTAKENNFVCFIKQQLYSAEITQKELDFNPKMRFYHINTKS
jgi:hypothetical protein